MQAIDNNDLVNKLTITQKLMKMKRKLYITTQEYHKLTSENFTAILARVNLASKNDIADFVKKQISILLDSNKKVTSSVLIDWNTNWIKPFNINLEPTMSNFANGSVTLKLNNSV